MRVLQAMFRIPIKNYLKHKRKDAPTILFFDDLDGILKTKKITEMFLENILTLANNKITAIIVCASNKPWDVESKILKVFENFLYIQFPSDKVRTKIYNKLKRIPNLKTVIDDEKINLMTNLTSGYSYATIVETLKKAITKMKSQIKNNVRGADFTLHFYYILEKKIDQHDQLLLKMRYGEFLSDLKVMINFDARKDEEYYKNNQHVSTGDFNNNKKYGGVEEEENNYNLGHMPLTDAHQKILKDLMKPHNDSVKEQLKDSLGLKFELRHPDDIFSKESIKKYDTTLANSGKITEEIARLSSLASKASSAIPSIDNSLGQNISLSDHSDLLDNRIFKNMNNTSIEYNDINTRSNNNGKKNYSTIEWSGFSIFINKQRIKFQHDAKNNMSEKEYMLNARRIFDGVDRYGSGIIDKDDFYMALRFDKNINQLFQPSLTYGLN
jgi:hypothetical protein